MNSFKQQCVELRKQDLSLNEIVKITRRPKTSVYFHVKNIPLSKERIEKYRKQNVLHLNEMSKLRKGKSFFGRSPTNFSTWTPSLVLLFGHSFFDGELTRNHFSYHSSHTVLITRVEKLMRLVYKFEPKSYENKATGVKRISYNNVELYPFMRTKQKELLNKISTLDKSQQLSFLKAFFDDEGCASFSRKSGKRLVRGYQNDIKTLEIIQLLLRSFEIESKIKLNKCNELVISRKENLIKFRDKINFSPGIRVNGNRSNSIWGKSLEKREILNMAINSYVK